MSHTFGVEFWADGKLITRVERLEPIKDVQVKFVEYDLGKKEELKK